MYSLFKYFQKSLTITQKLIISYLFIGIASTITISYLYYHSSREAIISRTLDQLSSVKYLKKEWIEDYLETQIRDIQLFSSLTNTTSSFELINLAFQKYGLKSRQYATADSLSASSLRQFMAHHKFLNIWFVNNQSDVFYATRYAIYKEDNLLNLKGLHPELLKAINLGISKTTLLDLPYISNENIKPGILLLTPIKGIKNQRLGTILVEMDIKHINHILTQRTGMGTTGESYVIDKYKVMRSQSRFIPSGIDKNIIVNTKAALYAFSGKEGHSIIKDYRGVDVLSSYTRINTKGINWALISEIDLEEAMKPIYLLRRKMIVIDLVIVLFIIGITNYLSQKISEMVIKYNSAKTAALVEGQENERRRMSRELHDGIGQMLTALKFKVQEINEKSEPVSQLKHLIDDTTNEVRRVSVNLMPSVLWDFGLESALNILIKNTNININFKYQKENDETELSMEVRTCLYRIAQESISNVLKYAETSYVNLFVNQETKSVNMEIEDNGKGFDLIEYKNNRVEKGSNGIRNMKERVSLVKGTFEILSVLGKGTTISVIIPL